MLLRFFGAQNFSPSSNVCQMKYTIYSLHILLENILLKDEREAQRRTEKEMNEQWEHR